MLLIRITSFLCIWPSCPMIYLQSSSSGSSYSKISLKDSPKYNISRYSQVHPVHIAMRGSLKEFAKSLLMEQDTLNVKDWQGMTPLHYAVSADNMDMVMLITAQPYLLINAQDSHGNTALHFAFLNKSYGKTWLR